MRTSLSKGGQPLSVGDEHLRVDHFDPGHFIIGKRGKFLLAAPLRQKTVILRQKAAQQFDLRGRHVDDLLDALAEPVKGFEKPDLFGQVALDRLLDTGVEAEIALRIPFTGCEYRSQIAVNAKFNHRRSKMS